MEIAVIQDKVLPMTEVAPAYLDRGVFFGDGVYEVLRSYNGKIFALDEHLERFAASLAKIGIHGVDIEQIRSRLLNAFEQAGIANAKIYFHVTRGSASREHIAPEELKPNFFLTITEFADFTGQKKNGISVCTFPDWRWYRCDIKSLNLLPNVLARLEAGKRNCEEAILVNDAGLITEGAGSAFFAVNGKALQTAPLTANVLPSITRKYAIKAAGQIGMEIVEKCLTVDQAACADELFIAVTTRDIVGVVRFDDKIIGTGKVGRYTRLVMEKFAGYVQ
jgi:D-alanine transaminase